MKNRTLLRGSLRVALLSLIVYPTVLGTHDRASAQDDPPRAAAPAPADSPAPAPVPTPGTTSKTTPRPSFPALPTLLTDYRGLHPGPTYDAAGKELTVGHLRLIFRSGTLTAILTASGREAGFVFDGAGRYAYTAQDGRDAQAFGKNLLKFENTSSYKDGTLGEDMKGCVFVSSTPILPDVLGDGAQPSGETPAGAASRISWLLADDDEANFGVEFPGAVASLAARTGRVVYARIDGKSVDPAYLYDPVWLHEEQLRLFKTVQGEHFFNVVSRQFVDGGWSAAPVVLTRLDYTLDTANNRDADLKVSETLSFPDPVGRVLPFSFWNNADTATRNWKSTRFGITVRSVKTADGKELPFAHRYHELLVELPEIPTPGTSTTLVFDIALHSLDTRGDEYIVLQGTNGFPEPAWQNSVRATSHWKLRTKKPYRSFTGGNVIKRSEEGGVLFLESEVDAPTDEPTVIAGKFDSKEFERNGLKVRVNIYGTGSGRAFDSYREMTFQLLGVYGQALAPYPRKEIDIMELKKSYSSISMPGLVVVSAEFARGGMVDSGTLRHADDYDGQGRGSGLGASVIESRKGDWQVRTFMHELAHQWFGNLVNTADFGRDRWISESVAEYLSALVYAAGAPNEKEKARKMNEACKDWWLDADMTRNSVSIASAWDLRGEWTESWEYTQIVYGRGPLVLRMLHSMMGEDRFFKVLTNVVTKYANKELSTDDFAREASAVQGQDMTWFFNQWIKQPGIPDLDVNQSIAHDSGKTYIAGHLKQHDRDRFKILVLPFVYTVNGKPAAKLVLMDKPEMDFKEEVEADASGVSVDPGRTMLVYYH